MILYGSVTSPFVRKCRITALESGVMDRIEFRVTAVLNDNGDHPNPLNMVPSLVTDDGTLIVDSRVICDYLASLGSQSTNNADWADRTLVAMADGLTDRAVSVYLESRRPDSEQSADWVKRCVTAIRATVAELEHRIPTAFTPGAIALTCALAYLDFRHDDLNWRDGAPALENWFDDIRTRQSVRDTEPPA